MDKEQLQQQIALFYSKLPKEAQEMFSKMEWLETLNLIGEKYTLKEEQVKVLGTETTLLLLGIISVEEYKNILTGELKISQESFSAIFSEIEEKIIKPILPKITEAYEINTKGATSEKKELRQKLDEKFKNLPKIEQDAIEQSNYQEVLYNIATAQKLTISQMGELEELVTSVMLDLIPREQFESSVIAKLGLLPDKARELTTEINEKILRKIKDAMISSTPPSIGKSDTEVLEQAGIKIINKPTQNFIKPQTITPQGMNDMKTTTIPSVTATGAISKLSQPFQMPKTKTEHSLNSTPRVATMSDLKKIGEIENKEQPIAPAPTQPATPKTISDIRPAANKPETVKVYPPKADPYRLSPEE